MRRIRRGAWAGVVVAMLVGPVAAFTPTTAAAAKPAKAAKASKRVANGACLRTEVNVRAAVGKGLTIACQKVGATFRWRVVTAVPAGPKHGDPCTERGANYPGTALDCVVVPGNKLQWRVRGTLRNPYRLGEPTEMYSLEGSRYRVVLTDWNPDVTQYNRDHGFDPAVPDVAFVFWRIQATLLESAGPGKANRTSEASVPFAYAITDQTRELQNVGLTDRRYPNPVADLPACRDGRIQSGFPATALKPRLETLQVGESGYDEWCKEVPQAQKANVVFESNGWFSAPKLDSSVALVVYFTGTPR